MTMKHKPKNLCTKTNDAYTQKNNFKGMFGWREGGREEIESREEVAGNSKERRARGRIQIFELVVNSHVL